MKKLLIICFIGLLLLFGCSDNPSQPNQPTQICHKEQECVETNWNGGFRPREVKCIRYTTREVCEDIKY